ncbi:hypothetical protein M1770_04465 [Spiroplasma citri]|nr:hypothetical protein [Spiroplasma citri]WFG99211.1 hypothetical protein M1770_04465 [Spiroplasma citri]
MKKFIFFLKNYCYISGSMLLFSLIDLLLWIISLYCVGLVFWLLFALQCVYFVWWFWKNIFYQLNVFRLVNFVWDNPVIEVQQINSERSWFFIEKKHYFILRSLVIKYGKDIVINTVNKIVINNVKENE